MSTTIPTEGPSAQLPPQQPQPAPSHYQPGRPPYQPAYQWQPQPAYGAPRPPKQPGAQGNFLHRWPVWAQNTALIVGAVAVLLVVFFGGYLAGHASAPARGGFGTNQNFTPRQFGGGNGGGTGGGTGNGGFSQLPGSGS